ncbi:hypothetical protein HELRODRAFT_158945 [Helobdella robusta]|uniref:Uncharacterized protein n=1 Tax=Helobdella robusta TaxID=6412 RepID=T1ENF5_HELRO|nr:hypothetical protein HELRODRAFT_158945 [Helobdella robusta]ESO12418.1 hypothetical protein HELRODRAFT_158945 [Helobdella robusta]
MIIAAKNVYKNAAGGTLTGKKLNIDWKTEKPIDNLVLKKFASKFPDLEMKSQRCQVIRQFDITESPIISHIKYAALNWSGFATQPLQQLQSLIEKIIRLNYLPSSYPAVTQI